MEFPDIDKQFLAKDAYWEWRIRIKKADKSIQIYSPYITSVIDQLLTFASISNHEIKVYTQVNAEYLLSNPYQLFTIRALLVNNITVSSILNLHAKLLVIDDRMVTVGSQNFTHNGRKNRECTIASTIDISKTNFKQQLENWKLASEVVDLKFIDALIEKLSSQIKKYENFVQDVNTQIDEIKAQFKEEKEKAKRKHFAQLYASSDVAFYHGKIEAKLELNGKYMDYYSLKPVYPDEKLTEWSFNDDNLRLPRLNWILMLNANTMQLHFARLGSSCISYLKNNNWYIVDNLHFGDLAFDVSIIFPTENTTLVNIEVELSIEEVFCNVRLFFDGKVINIVDLKTGVTDEDYLSEYQPLMKIIEAKVKKAFRRKRDLYRFLKYHMEAFSAVAHMSHHNVDEYFNTSNYYLNLVEFYEMPFLVIDKHNW